jgi:hypothetical protein
MIIRVGGSIEQVAGFAIGGRSYAQSQENWDYELVEPDSKARSEFHTLGAGLPIVGHRSIKFVLLDETLMGLTGTFYAAIKGEYVRLIDCPHPMHVRRHSAAARRLPEQDFGL